MKVPMRHPCLVVHRQVGLRLKNPGSGIAGSPGHHVPSLITDTIKSLDDDMYETQHMRIYPIRSLLPPFALATAIGELECTKRRVKRGHK